MNERIKQIRKHFKLSQEEFGNKIKITRSSVCKLETGENNPSDQTIMLICKEFSINEEWLRAGEGEMYKATEDEIAAIVSDLLEEDNPLYSLIIGIMKTYQKLDDKSQAVLRNFTQELLDNMKKRD